MGFFNERSLRIVWSASRYSQPPLHFPGIITSDSMNLQLIQSGHLRRIIIAAKFNATAHVGWPKLQIMRINVEQNTYDIVASTTNTTEPRPTGYLNVYEYEFNNSVAVQIGDEVAISWHGNVSQTDQIRYSLAYYIISSGSRVPMVSIIVGDCGPETDWLTSNIPQCEEMNITTTSDSPGPYNTVSRTPATDNELTSTTTNPKLNFSNTTATMTMGSMSATQASINQTVNSESEVKLSTTSDKTTIISGTVVFSLIMIILLIFVVVLTLTLVVKRRRKSTSMNVTDPIEMSTQPRTLHNTSSESITDSTHGVKLDEAEDYIEVNHVYATDTLPTDPNVAYGTVDCIEVDSNPAHSTDTVPTDTNVAYGSNATTVPTYPNVAYGTTNYNAVPTSPTVAYGTHPPQIHDYEYVAFP